MPWSVYAIDNYSIILDHYLIKVIVILPFPQYNPQLTNHCRLHGPHECYSQ